MPSPPPDEDIADKAGHLCLVGHDALTRGAVSDAEGAYREALGLLTEPAYPYGLAFAGIPLTEVLLAQGRDVEALTAIELARFHAGAADDRRILAHADLTLAKVLAVLGEPDRALPLLEAAEAEYKERGVLLHVAEARIARTGALHALERFDEAHQAIEAAAVSTYAIEVPVLRGALALAWGRLDHQLGQLDTGKLDLAVHTFREVGAPVLELEALLARACLARDLGEDLESWLAGAEQLAVAHSNPIAGGRVASLRGQRSDAESLLGDHPVLRYLPAVDAGDPLPDEAPLRSSSSSPPDR